VDQQPGFGSEDGQIVHSAFFGVVDCSRGLAVAVTTPRMIGAGLQLDLNLRLAILPRPPPNRSEDVTSPAAQQPTKLLVVQRQPPAP
jgi:hypothetical protein